MHGLKKIWNQVKGLLGGSRQGPLPMPIVVGAARSGTTLLRFMLDSHSELAIPPETGFLPELVKIDPAVKNWHETVLQCLSQTPRESPTWPDFQISVEEMRLALAGVPHGNAGEAARQFYRLYAKRFGKKRFGDKTPAYCRSMQAIEMLLPEAAFIHLIRDGRDVACSLRPLWFSPGQDWKVLAQRWCDDVNQARQAGRNCKRYLEIHYEALLESPELTLRKICEHVKLRFEPAMLNYFERAPQRLAEHQGRTREGGEVWLSQQQRQAQQWRTTQPLDPSRVGAWKELMSPDEHAQFCQVAGDLLRSLGYRETV